MINNTLVCTTIVRMRGASLCAHAYYYLRLFRHKTDQQFRVKRNHAQDRTTQPSNADLSNKESALYQRLPSQIWILSEFVRMRIWHVYSTRTTDVQTGVCIRTSVRIAWAHARRIFLTSVLLIARACEFWPHPTTQPWRDKRGQNSKKTDYKVDARMIVWGDSMKRLNSSKLKNADYKLNEKGNG